MKTFLLFALWFMPAVLHHYYGMVPSLIGWVIVLLVTLLQRLENRQA